MAFRLLLREPVAERVKNAMATELPVSREGFEIDVLHAPPGSGLPAHNYRLFLLGDGSGEDLDTPS